MTMIFLFEIWNTTSLVMKFGWIYKGIYKIGDQMCELNYKETKIEIEVKLGDQKYNFT